MTLTLELPPELEKRLSEQAGRLGMPAERYTLQLLEEHLPPEDRRQKLVSLLQSWIDDEDADDQRETGKDLITALDEDRLSDRKLFPPELQGVTW